MKFSDLIITSEGGTRYISLATFNSIKDNAHRFDVEVGYSLYDE